MKANLIPIILKKSSKFKRFLMQNVKTTRNSLTINPLEEYSITSPTVVNNNVLVRQGAYGFVGGDTEYLSYDFGLKVAGSVIECPMKIYRYAAPTLFVPGDVNWIELTTQSDIDSTKTQDNNPYSRTVTSSGAITQLMIELDLTPVANALYGGSNSALKSALKSIQVDVWASGYGANTGVQTNGCQIQLYNFIGSAWGGGDSGIINYTGSTITKNTLLLTTAPSYRVNSSNKIYFLINSMFPSDGTIASSVSLDYINIGIQLTRTPDVINPINVNVPKYWAMLVKGLSPIHSSLDTLSSHAGIFDLNNGTATNRFVLYIDKTTKNISFIENINSNSTSGNLTSGNWNKYQVTNILFVKQQNSIKLYALTNNNTLVSANVATTNVLTGSLKLQIFNTLVNEKGNAFAESFTLLDLNKLGKANGFSDAEADAILRGTIPNLIGSYNVELFDITKVILHANASLSGGVITLNATAGFQDSTIDIPVLPNNQYTLSYNKNGANGYLKLVYYYNNILLSFDSSISLGVNGSGTFTKILPSNCNKVKLIFSSNAVGTFTFSQISLKIKM